MRDYFLLAIILAILPLSFVRPHMGIYAWFWVSVMNPHRLTWGIAYSFPVAMMVGVATLLGALLKPRPLGRLAQTEVWIIIALMALMTFNTTVAMFPSLAWERWDQVMKVLLMTLATIWLIDTKVKLRWVLIVVTLSVGFFAVKAVPWMITTGGQYRIAGPHQSSIGSNNSLAMGLNMLIPLMLFFASHEKRRWVRLGFFATFLASTAGVVVSYSRGAFLGAIAVFSLLFLRSKRKVPALVGLFCLVSLVVTYVPQKWFERMDTIRSYEEEGSAQERIQTWHFAADLAFERPLTGGGFQAFRANPSDFDAHSVYFGWLAEQGFIAFGLFLLLIACTFLNLAAIRRRTKRTPELRWYFDLAGSLQISIVAYMVNGLTLNHQYLDLFYFLVAAAVILKLSLASEYAAQVAAPAADPAATSFDDHTPVPVGSVGPGASHGLRDPTES